MVRSGRTGKMMLLSWHAKVLQVASETMDAFVGALFSFWAGFIKEAACDNIDVMCSSLACP